MQNQPPPKKNRPFPLDDDGPDIRIADQSLDGLTYFLKHFKGYGIALGRPLKGQVKNSFLFFFTDRVFSHQMSPLNRVQSKRMVRSSMG